MLSTSQKSNAIYPWNQETARTRTTKFSHCEPPPSFLLSPPHKALGLGYLLITYLSLTDLANNSDCIFHGLGVVNSRTFEKSYCSLDCDASRGQGTYSIYNILLLFRVLTKWHSFASFLFPLLHGHISCD